jgi:hypothetical protein
VGDWRGVSVGLLCDGFAIGWGLRLVGVCDWLGFD